MLTIAKKRLWSVSGNVQTNKILADDAKKTSNMHPNDKMLKIISDIIENDLNKSIDEYELIAKEWINKYGEKYINSYDLGIENNKAVPIEYIVYDTESSMKIGNIKLWFTEDSVLFYNESMCSNIIKIKSDIIIVQKIIVECIFRNRINIYPKSWHRRLRMRGIPFLNH